MNSIDLSTLRPTTKGGQRVYIETYGCQMNIADSEVVLSILQNDGWLHTQELVEADLILVNTCSIRDSAEQRIWTRLFELRKWRKESDSKAIVGLLGCMASRLKEKLLERKNLVEIIAGPDSYRDLPKLINAVRSSGQGVNVMLSSEETYGEILPVRLDRNGVSAFVSIMRGCNNMCSYCVVPSTRGRERSREPQTILKEVRGLFAQGYREVTLLGQNVNSYRWSDEIGGQLDVEHGEVDVEATTVEAGFGSVDFPALLAMVADIDPLLRVRFSTSHPKDLSNNLLMAIASRANICHNIHLPAQSGSSRLLDLMNRHYDREWYLGRIAAIRDYLPDASITTDIIAGFSSETDDDHQQTLSLMREVGYVFAYMYRYSERPGTKASRVMKDDVSEEIKRERLAQIIALQRELSMDSNRRDIGLEFEVLIDSVSKRSDSRLAGRTSQNKTVVFDRAGHNIGEYVRVRITDCSSATLFGEVLEN